MQHPFRKLAYMLRCVLCVSCNRIKGLAPLGDGMDTPAVHSGRPAQRAGAGAMAAAARAAWSSDGSGGSGASGASSVAGTEASGVAMSAIALALANAPPARGAFMSPPAASQRPAMASRALNGQDLLLSMPTPQQQLDALPGQNTGKARKTGGSAKVKPEVVQIVAAGYKNADMIRAMLTTFRRALTGARGGGSHHAGDGGGRAQGGGGARGEGEVREERGEVERVKEMYASGCITSEKRDAVHKQLFGDMLAGLCVYDD